MTKEVLEALKETAKVLKEYEEKETIEVYNNIWIGVLKEFKEHPSRNAIEINFYHELNNNKPLPREKVDKLKEMLYQDGFTNISDNNNETLIITRAKLYQLLKENTKDQDKSSEEKTKTKVK